MNLVPTFLAALLLVGSALFLLAIGWILAGKKLQRGCGLNPEDSKKENCGTKEKCPLCDPNKKDKDKK
jgi:hypothetical protein